MNLTSQPRSQMSRKLRASCDACGDAKTKCDRGQPNCMRCRNMNLTCVYGPSRQFGKRPRRRLDTGRNVLTETPSTAPATSNLTSLAPTNSSIQPPAPNAPPSILAEMEASMMAQGFTSNMVNTPSGTNAVHSHAFGDPGLFLPSLPSAWPQFENYDSNEYMLTTPLSFPESHESTIPTPPAAPELPSRHRCYHEPNEILGSLTIPQEPGNYYKKTLELSQILHANRNAIEAIERFLKCRCAKTQPDLLTLQSSLTARVLYFYRQAAGVAADDFSRSSSDTASCSTVADTFSQDSGPPDPRTFNAPGNRCFLVVEMPFKVGTFNVDTPAVQFAFRNHLIGSEVKKIEPVVEGFAALGEAEGVPEENKGLYTSIGAWLKKDYANTMQITKDALQIVAEKM
ncbi:hypothetical protein P280DRAFT_468015 [Massarina eburnea CBS 473.64]|uniref:Zn(2)-C6 fungal-type domain-containing protein n=1 Tax=Massarina eburnea CBS 473.64 TaxID=1395130 RepID=A0A6A6S691_9PLEO|nr:hypothetical protein P280DRAFT_468015 [Massarina eburnea CBS 473.64]